MTPQEISPELEQSIETFREWVNQCPPGGMVFFGGAGVSTESGIPDFRSTDGLYNQSYAYPPEVMISRSFFDAHPSEFFRFYFDRMIYPDAKPNQAHRKLAALEKEGILRSVVTQNIDGLHQAGGSKRVWELHGSVLRNYCMACGKEYDLNETIAAHEAAEDGIPRCNVCRGIIKPDVVLYEEPLNGQIMQGAILDIRKAKLLVIAGTSLVVNPAASLVGYFGGDHLVIINRTPTPRDRYADLVIPYNVGEVFDF